MEKFVLLPFSSGCVSASSVSVAARQPKKPKDDSSDFIKTNEELEEEYDGDDEDEDDDESFSGESNKGSFRSMPLLKPNISIHKFFKGFKNLSQYFVYKEEMEAEMVIGGPTDVKHVTHIGLESSAANEEAAMIMGWENLAPPPLDLLPLPPVPWRPSFDFSMAAQADHTPLVSGSS